MPDALTLLLGRSAEAAKKAAAAPKRSSNAPSEDLIKAIADFRSAPSDVDAADALLLAVELAKGSGSADVED